MSKRPKYRRIIDRSVLKARAQLAEQVDAADLKSADDGHTGSNPALRTIIATPRTDEVAKADYVSQFEYSAAMTRHARDLERELHNAIVRLGTLAAQLRPVKQEQPVAPAPKKKWKDPYEEKLQKMSNDEVMISLRRYKAVAVMTIDAAKSERGSATIAEGQKHD